MVTHTENRIVIDVENSCLNDLVVDFRLSVAEVIKQIDFEELEGWTPLELKIRFCIRLMYIFVDEKIAQEEKERTEKNLATARELIKKFNLANNHFYYSH